MNGPDVVRGENRSPFDSVRSADPIAVRTWVRWVASFPDSLGLANANTALSTCRRAV